MGHGIFPEIADATERVLTRWYAVLNTNYCDQGVSKGKSANKKEEKRTNMFLSRHNDLPMMIVRSFVVGKGGGDR